MASIRTKRDVWTRCERGHLFYQAFSTTRCHVCKAHNLPPVDPLAALLPVMGYGPCNTPESIREDATLYRDGANDALMCLALTERQNVIGGWVRLNDPNWIYSHYWRTRSRASSTEWRMILTGEHRREVGRRRRGILDPGTEIIYADEGEFDHARHAADEEARILEISRAYVASLRDLSFVPPDPELHTVPKDPSQDPRVKPTRYLHDAHVKARPRRKGFGYYYYGATRNGQADFRADVLRNYDGRCAITGTAIDVEAAHIEPWRENGNQEPDNGVPLVWALHKCYDRIPAMFAIHPDTLRIHVRADVVGLESIDGKQIADGKRFPLNRDALRARWAEFVLLDNT